MSTYQNRISETKEKTTARSNNKTIQKKNNKTGLPDNLKRGIEKLSSYSMDDVKVHYNSDKPAQLNAHAYAKGNDIHVASGQEKHLAHEAWHVVQQKQGRVLPTAQMKGIAGAKSSNASVLQMYHIQDNVKGKFLAQQSRKTDDGETFLSEETDKANLKLKKTSGLRVADTGELAIENGGDSREAKMFFGTSGIQKHSNQVMKQLGSPIRFGINPSKKVAVQDSNGVKNSLSMIYPIDVIEKTSGHSVKTPEICNEAGPHILNTTIDSALTPKFKNGSWASNINNPRTDDTKIRVLDFFKNKKDKRELEVFFKTYWKTNWLRATINPILSKVLDETRHDRENEELADLNAKINHPENEKIKDVYNRYGQDDVGLVKAYAEALTTPEGQRIIKELGINEAIDPEVGEMLSIRSNAGAKDIKSNHTPLLVYDHVTEKDIPDPFPYHYASVIAKSGSDYVTMENYARREKKGGGRKDPRFFFQMYGKENQSFHAEQKSDYPSPMTFVYGHQAEKKKYPEFDYESKKFHKMEKGYNKYFDKKFNH